MTAPARLVAWSVSHPRRVLLAWSLLALVSGWSALGVRIDTSAESVLDRADPAYAFHKRSQALFGGEELIAVAIAADDAWDPRALQAVIGLTRTLEATPGVRRVDSLKTVPLIRTTPEGELDLGSGLDAGLPETPQQRAALAEAVRNDRIAPRHLVSDDGRVFAINLLLEDIPSAQFAAVVGAVERDARSAQARISGVPVFRRAINTQTRDELLVFGPVTLSIVALLLAAIFRSAWALVVALGSAAAGVLVMLGAMGAAGASITLITLILPSIVLALGCAYAMHVLTAAQAAPSGQPLAEALAETALPIALSGITTAIGFFSIASIRIDVVREVGLFGGVGVLSALAATLTLAPALLRLAPVRPC
ncbi:MAG TPA: MMPL family transporter, partial [Myxococcota bacterium]